MTEIICALICFLLSVLAFLISIRSFQEKGFLFNNAYIYASKQEREKMDKKPYYRQSAIAFALVGIVLALLGIAMLLSAAWITFLAMAVGVVVLIYAVSSEIAIERKKK